MLNKVAKVENLGTKVTKAESKKSSTNEIQENHQKDISSVKNQVKN